MSQVEDNRFSVSIHYRNCARVDVPRVKEVVERVQARHERIRMGSGKEVSLPAVPLLLCLRALCVLLVCIKSAAVRWYITLSKGPTGPLQRMT